MACRTEFYVRLGDGADFPARPRERNFRFVFLLFLAVGHDIYPPCAQSRRSRRAPANHFGGAAQRFTKVQGPALAVPFPRAGRSAPAPCQQHRRLMSFYSQLRIIKRITCAERDCGSAVFRCFDASQMYLSAQYQVYCNAPFCFELIGKREQLW